MDSIDQRASAAVTQSIATINYRAGGENLTITK
jgi:hypothetical protein